MKAEPINPRRTLVIGGAGGIGAAIATSIASQPGSIVLVADREHPVSETPASYLHVDVTDTPSIDALFSEVDSRWGGLDALVYTPGIGVTKHFLDVTLEDWNRILDVNLHGAFRCCSAAANRMRRTKSGSIVVLSSVAGQRPSGSSSPYSATKAALELYVRGLAMENGSHGIRANIIAPGSVETALAATLHTGDRRRRFTERIALGRYAHVKEIAGVARFLASTEASFITGQVLYVDGGMSIANILDGNEEPR